jgi:flavin reductase (DIM6/NTAB) family NADH-FMN oxidoreductase RutF
MSQPAPEPGLDANFRLAMRRLAATVSIVTCKDGDGRHGITATAIASVCLEPPTVLVCINARTRLYTKIAERHRFCINLLKTCHIELSRQFGSRDLAAGRFTTGDWTELDDFVYLRDAQANLFCSLQKVVEVGTHGIFIAAVERLGVASEIDPLIYQDGRYVTAQDTLR